jgi:iron(III) transport system substrate-binding protein
VLKDGASFEYAVNGDANPKLVPLADLDAPKLDSKKVVELMTAAGLR